MARNLLLQFGELLSNVLVGREEIAQLHESAVNEDTRLYCSGRVEKTRSLECTCFGWDHKPINCL